MAVELARREGIDDLTDKHWEVIRFMRREYAEKGTGPTVGVLGKTSGVTINELYQLLAQVAQQGDAGEAVAISRDAASLVDRLGHRRA
jgi:sulfur relay (sulfurtransferase) DsrC/TusE family protein